MTVRAGFAQLDITPPAGLPLGGYGMRTGGADGALDPLFCRAVVLDDDTGPVAVVVLDLVYVFADWTARVRVRAGEVLGLAADRLLISATHTHAGPGVFRSALSSDVRLRCYEDALVDRVVECLCAANAASTPAHLRCGKAAAAGVAANRRDPSLPIDEAVRVLCVHDESGQLRGVLANFACHPTVLSAANHSYSADLFGAAVETASHELGVPVLLTNGAAGDVSTRFTRRTQTPGEARRLGALLANAVCAGVRRASRVGRRSDRHFFDAATQSLQVRWRHLPAPDAAVTQLQRELTALQSLRAAGASAGAVRLAESRVEGAQAEAWVSSQGGWEALFGSRQPAAPVQALRCGAVAIVGAPGELFSSAAQWLRRRLGDTALVIGYANDYLGYLIPEHEVSAGGYESLIAMVDPTCEATIRSGLVDVAQSAGCEIEAADG
jgi:hypothetical protein